MHMDDHLVALFCGGNFVAASTSENPHAVDRGGLGLDVQPLAHGGQARHDARGDLVRHRAPFFAGFRGWKFQSGLSGCAMNFCISGLMSAVGTCRVLAGTCSGRSGCVKPASRRGGGDGGSDVVDAAVIILGSMR